MSRTRRWIAAAVAVAATLALPACGVTLSPPSAAPPAAVSSPTAAASAPHHHRHHHHPSAPPSVAVSAPAPHRHRHHHHAVSASTSPALLQVHDPGQVTGSLIGPCATRDGGQLPDPHCTPGAFDPAITAAILCSGAYSTSSYRPPESATEAVKFSVVEAAYGQADVSGELDHLVPLELGGANDLSNLWVEAGPIPNAKDAVENALHDHVCSASGAEAQARLRKAQVAIAADWMTAEQRLGISP